MIVIIMIITTIINNFHNIQYFVFQDHVKNINTFSDNQTHLLDHYHNMDNLEANYHWVIICTIIINIFLLTKNLGLANNSVIQNHCKKVIIIAISNHFTNNLHRLWIITTIFAIWKQKIIWRTKPSLSSSWII